MPSWMVASTYSCGAGAVVAADEVAQPRVGGRGAQQPLERPGQRVGGRLVPGEHQRHQLVAQLVIGEGLAVLVAGGEQQREHVGAAIAVPGGAPLADHRVHLAVDHRHHRREHALGLGVARVAHLHQQVQRRHGRGQHAPQRLAHPALGVAGDRSRADAEDPAHDHLEGHRLHPGRQRERLTHRPAVDLLLGDVGDHLHVALHRLAVKRRQQQLALAQVARADRGEHRVRAQDRPQRRLAGQRRRIRGIGRQQRADVVGVAGDRRTPRLGSGTRSCHTSPNRRWAASAKLIGRRGEAQALQRRGQPERRRHVSRRARVNGPGGRGQRRRSASRRAATAGALSTTVLTVRKCTARG